MGVIDPEHERRARAYGRRCILAAAVLWSLSGTITKALPLGALAIAFYRSLFAGLAIWPFVPRSHWKLRPAMIGLGLCFGAMIGFYIGAVKATTAANAIYLQYTSTFWMIPLSLVILRERPDRRSVVGIALAMVGIAVIVAFGYDGRPNEWHGIALGLASGLGYAIVATTLRGLRDLDPTWLSAFSNLTGALTLGAWMLATTHSIALPTPAQSLVLLAFGVIQMAVPYALFARGLREVGAPEAGLIALIEPVLNPIWVVLINHEIPTGPTLIGGLFLLAGLAYRSWPTQEPQKDPAQKRPSTRPRLPRGSRSA
jgi:drug/metabolite transporter, DME family